MENFKFLIIDHFPLACEAFLWFFGGALLVIPSSRWKRNFCESTCRGILNLIKWLFGRDPGFFRTATTIFLFNGSAMLIYMSLGVRPEIPKLIASITGFTIALCFSMPREEGTILEINRPGFQQWLPSSYLTAICGILTVLLELPSFWYTIAMGISLGEEVLRSPYSYLVEHQLRVSVYSTTVLPVLFVSAICETVAIWGARTPSQ